MNLITMDGNKPILSDETAAKIADFERLVKSIKEQEEALKTAILCSGGNRHDERIP